MKYKYTIKTGRTRIATNIRRYAAGAILSGAMLCGLAVPAFAAGNSVPGSDRYTDNPGRVQAGEVGAQCGSGAGSGAFGYLGKGNNPGDPSWDGGNGADPGTTAQTGVNNSAVCGNRQGNL
ncbi:MAG TPA: hypothetical protein VL737_01240 [Candidatus Pristimantibacillus sp.]|nr:hypothetical protein [Candidatus Pristimantibacillus sp.]